MLHCLIIVAGLCAATANDDGSYMVRVDRVTPPAHGNEIHADSLEFFTMATKAQLGKGFSMSTNPDVKPFQTADGTLVSNNGKLILQDFSYRLEEKGGKSSLTTMTGVALGRPCFMGGWGEESMFVTVFPVTEKLADAEIREQIATAMYRLRQERLRQQRESEEMGDALVALSLKYAALGRTSICERLLNLAIRECHGTQAAAEAKTLLTRVRQGELKPN